jgi:hypothetical protein
MKAALSQFNDNIQRAKSLGELHNSLPSVTGPVLDASDILRSELVLAVSALDCYIHEIVEKGMIEIFENKRSRTNSFLKFKLSVECIMAGLSSTGTTEWLSNEIRSNLSYRAFQQPDKIAEAVKIISHKKVWPEVSSCLGRDKSDITNQLTLIVERRNKITHESDRNPAFPGTRWPISAQMVNDAIDFLQEIAYCIDYIVNN